MLLQGLQNTRTRLVVDMSGVTFTDASGLRTVHLVVRAAVRDRKIVLIRPSRAVRRLAGVMAIEAVERCMEPDGPS